MPVTITVSQLSEALRLSVSGAPTGPYLGIVTRQLAAATATIEQYARDDTPPELLNEAAVRLVSYLIDSEPANPSRNVSTPTSSFRNSGAKSLLSPFHKILSTTL